MKMVRHKLDQKSSFELLGLSKLLLRFFGAFSHPFWEDHSVDLRAIRLNETRALFRIESFDGLHQITLHSIRSVENQSQPSNGTQTSLTKHPV